MSLNREQMKNSGYEPVAGLLKWEKIGDIPAPGEVVDDNYSGAFVHSVAIDEHRVLVIDETIQNVHESFVRLFNTSTKEWDNEEEWPSLNQGRWNFTSVLCNRKVYAIGGMKSDDGRVLVLDSIECLDLSVSPRQWITLDQRLRTARSDCSCVAIDAKVFILGGDGQDGNNMLVSVEILNTETSQLVPGPSTPQYEGFTAGAVNSELLVFAKPAERDGDVGEIHTLRQGQPNSTWETTSFPLRKKPLAYKPIVFGDCVLLSTGSVYDTHQGFWWEIPTIPYADCGRALVGKSEIISFGEEGIHSLKLKRSVQPLTEPMPRHTKSVLKSMLYSPDFSDVLFVCPDGVEVPAHRTILATKNPYFRAYFGGPWKEQHPDGRWETEKSSDVIKALLSLMYTGGVTGDVSDSTLFDLLETVYEFELDEDLVRVCQQKCIENIGVSNVKDLLLSAKVHDATFLFDACFNYVCEHFSEFGSNPDFAQEIIQADKQLWRDIFQSLLITRKRKRGE